MTWDDDQPKHLHSVMVVDDEEFVLQTLRSILTLETDFQVLTFNSAVEALQRGQESAVDCIVSDLSMPGMDGLTFLNAMRKRHPAVPAIILTGKADLNQVVRAVNENELFAFVLKPWESNDDLVAKIRRAVDYGNLTKLLHEFVPGVRPIKSDDESFRKVQSDIRENMQRAMDVQKPTLPERLPDGFPYALFHLYNPLWRIGGDVLDAQLTPGGSLLAIIADVQGHGIAAAQEALGVRAFFRDAVRESADCHGVLTKIQTRLVEYRFPLNVDACVLRCDWRAGQTLWTVATAGHTCPILVLPRAHERAELSLRAPGLLLSPNFGLPGQGENRWDIAEYVSGPGDRILLSSDGLWEDESEEGAGDSQFEAVKLAVNLLRGCRGRDLLPTLFDNLGFRDGRRKQTDDVTVLLVEHTTRD